MLRSLRLTNVTLFQQAELVFSPGLNVLVGENGCGKTYLLKLAYAMAACLQEPLPTRTAMQGLLADKLVGVLRPEAQGLVQRHPVPFGKGLQIAGAPAAAQDPQHRDQQEEPLRISHPAPVAAVGNGLEKADQIPRCGLTDCGGAGFGHWGF